MGMFAYIIMGIVFVSIGNYLPKCKQNYTAGIKIPWTLNSTENWNRTHRLAGWLYILCGIAFFANVFFQWTGMIWIVLAVAVVPMVYSFILYKKGIWERENKDNQCSRIRFGVWWFHGNSPGRAKMRICRPLAQRMLTVRTTIQIFFLSILDCMRAWSDKDMIEWVNKNSHSKAKRMICMQSAGTVCSPKTYTSFNNYNIQYALKKCKTNCCFW